MACRGLPTDGVVRDLEEIRDYTNARDSRARADDVLDRIEEAFQAPSEQPHRGRYPSELLDIGIREYREVFFKPYRIIYRVIGETVNVVVIADGRRDMQSLLERRLLEG